VFTPECFNFAKFLASLMLKEDDLSEMSTERYVKPLANYLNKMIMGSEPPLQRCELKERLELVIGYTEAEWLSNNFWIHFVN